MENGEGKPKPRYEYKSVFIGKNPDTGVPYFEKRRVRIVDINEPPEDPPNEDLSAIGNTRNESIHSSKRYGNYNADIVSKAMDDKADADKD